MHYPSASTAYPHPLLNKTSNCCRARLSIPHAVVRSLSSYDESKNCSSLPVSRTIDLPSRVKSLTSTSNPFVKHCLKLRQSSSYRHTHGSALIIGSTPIREIYKFHMLKQERQNTLVDCLFLLDGTDVPEGLDDGLVRIVHVSSTVMRRLSGVQSMESVEAIALMRIPSSFLNLNNSKLGGDCKGWFSCPHRILVLEGIQDPGNLGTLIRSAMAFKWHFSEIQTAYRLSRSTSLCLVAAPIEIMPRRSSGGRPAQRAAPRPAPARNPPPQPVSHAPPPASVPASSGGSMVGGLGATIAQGMAFGTGSAVAHRAVDAVLGPRTIQHETVVSETASAAATPMTKNVGGQDSCGIHSKAFQDCLNSYGSDISKCQFYLDMLNECRRASGSVMGA